jgi:hypothetical protein
MELIDSYRKDSVLDRYTFVFDEHDPRTGYYTMLAMSEDGYTFSQWTSGLYDPHGGNEHLGRRVVLSAIGARALDGLCSRLSIPDEWEHAYQTIEQIIREDGDAGDDQT